MKNIFNRSQTNFELEDIARSVDLNIVVCMKDELIGKIPDGLYIVNLENSDDRGTHWTALYKTKGKYYYSDSFGMPIPQTLINNLKIKEDNLFFNNCQLQDMSSSVCGFFALYFLSCMNMKKPIKDKIDMFLRTFDLDDQLKNDKIIKSIFNNIV